MLTVRLACIVEGHGEVAAVPVLLRRVAQTVNPAIVLEVERPIRVTKSRLLQQGEWERAVRLARSFSAAGVIAVLDSDDDCAAALAPLMLSRAASAGSPIPVAVVFAVREFEAWFLAAAASLRGRRGLPADLEPPPDPESIRGAKEWLAGRMQRGVYSPTLDQAALAGVFDLQEARRAPSFDKFYRAVTDLLTLSGGGRGGG